MNITARDFDHRRYFFFFIYLTLLLTLTLFFFQITKHKMDYVGFGHCGLPSASVGLDNDLPLLAEEDGWLHGLRPLWSSFSLCGVEQCPSSTR